MNKAAAGRRHRRKSLRAEDAKISRKTMSYAVAAVSTAPADETQKTIDSLFWVDTMPSPPLSLPLYGVPNYSKKNFPDFKKIPGFLK